MYLSYNPLMRTHTRPALAVGALALLLATGCSAPADDTPSTTASASADVATSAPTTSTSTTPASTAAVASPTSADGFNTPEAASEEEQAVFVDGLKYATAGDEEWPADDVLLEQGEMACMQLANGATLEDVVVDESEEPGSDYNVKVGNSAVLSLCPEVFEG